MMNGYRWTVRVARVGLGRLVAWAAFVTVARIFDWAVAGVQRAAWVMTAIMTAPLTIVVVSVHRFDQFNS